MWRDILKISTEDAIQDARRYAPKDVREGEKEAEQERLESIKPAMLNLTTQYMQTIDSRVERRLLNSIKQLMRRFPSAPKLRSGKNLNEAHIYEFLGEELKA